MFYLLSKFVFCYSVLFLFAKVSFSQPKNLEQSGQTYGVVIGISVYQQSQISRLNFAENDATLFAAYLQSAAGGKVPSQNIKLMLGSKASIANIYEALTWLKNVCKQGDKVFFYFSGHGDVETNDQQNAGYLLAWNSPANNYRNNAIRIEDINNDALVLSQSKKVQVVLITDACRSGSLAGDLFKGKQLVAKRLGLSRTGEARLASCGPDELAAESKEWDGGRGVFSYYLLHGLTGMADRKGDGRVVMEELTTYLDSCFAADKILKAEKHKQNPILLGNPVFELAKVDKQTLSILNEKVATGSQLTVANGMGAGTWVSMQPIDYFFDMLDTLNIEKLIQPEVYAKGPFPVVQLAFIDSCKVYFQSDYWASWKEVYLGDGIWEKQYIGPDTLMLDSLKRQLVRVKRLQSRFNEKLGLLVHSKAQQRVNAYLKGDLAELNRRQYYDVGTQNPRDFLSIINLGIGFTNTQPAVQRLLRLQYVYLSGLEERRKLLLNPNQMAGVKKAFAYQREALAIDPYAAYIHNELGILHLRKSRFDSAQIAFSRAMQIAPTWALPWSNMISLHLATGKLDQAKQAAQKVKTLQTNLPYAMVNEALVWEKEKNYLQAEALYLKAIKLNNVHFFPYERLGLLYLETGNYQKADSFLYEAGLRKNDYTIMDEQYFNFGMGAGGFFENTLAAIFPEGSDMAPPSTTLEVVFLSRGLRAFAMGKPEMADSLLNVCLQIKPAMPLAHHYLGLIYAKQEKWQAAADAFNMAVENFYVDSALDDFFGYHRPKVIWDRFFDEERKDRTDTASLFIRGLLSFQYDQLEDYFWLGKIYEKTGKFALALEAYEAAHAIEKERAFDRATFKDRQKIVELAQLNFIRSLDYKEFTEIPVPMFAAFKIAAIYEQLGAFFRTEDVLLKHIEFTRTLAQVRYQQEYKNFIESTNFIPDVFPLKVGADAESALFMFYDKMMGHYPSMSYWHEKAGWFYYERFKIVFNRIEVAAHPALYRKLLVLPFPWVGTHWSEGERWELDQKKALVLPGTLDTVFLHLPKYNPILKGISLLERSMQLSGSLQPDIKKVYALAEMNTWCGNEERARLYFDAYLQQEPGDADTRKRFIAWLQFLQDYPVAFEQTGVLYTQNQLEIDELFGYANQAVFKGDYKLAGNILAKEIWRNYVDSPALYFLNGISFTLQKDYKEAMGYLKAANVEPRDLLPNLLDDSGDDVVDKAEAKRLYALARLYVLEDDHKGGMKTIKQALDAGFLYENVLKNDPVTKPLRLKPEWKKMIEGFTWEDPVPESVSHGDNGDHKYLFPFEYKNLPFIYRE
jgi:tetratricopeptide (TPR) repeat protein